MLSELDDILRHCGCDPTDQVMRNIAEAFYQKDLTARASQREGQLAGGASQRSRARRENAPLVEAYQAWRKLNSDERQHPKAAFIREWIVSGMKPHRGERQIYAIISRLNRRRLLEARTRK